MLVLKLLCHPTIPYLSMGCIYNTICLKPEDQNIPQIVVFQRVSRCLELWRAMSIALSASSPQMAGTLSALSRFPRDSLHRLTLLIFQGFDQTINLILDETHERVYSATQGVEQVTLNLQADFSPSLGLLGVCLILSL